MTSRSNSSMMYKRKKIRECMESEFIALKLFFLFLCLSFFCYKCSHHLGICHSSWILLLVLKCFIYCWGKAVCGSVTCREYYCRYESILTLPVSCLFMCLSENWKATLIIMISWAISSEVSRDWKSS